MNDRRKFAVLAAALTAALVSGCGPQRVQTHVRAGEDLIALLPDPGEATIGRAVVTNSAGAVQLTAARDFTTVSPTGPPAPVVSMSEADARQLFADVLSFLPPAPQHFTLNFLFESDELTDQSRALVPQILQAIKDRPVPDVAAVGHTDTTGTAEVNVELGLRRASAIRSLLVDAGVDAALIEVTSHGETDLLVNTADEVYEPRNRRVDITIR